MSAALTGRSVVITRPAGVSQRLQALVREAGAVPLLFPAIEICDALDRQPLDEAITHLDEFDLAIFISPSAVEKAMTRIVKKRALPATLRCVAIGPGGARALERYGVREVIVPDNRQGRYDSESLLESDFMQEVRGKRVVIFRGNGGRELLRETLSARGATVQAVTCYRRTQPVLDIAPLMQAWVRGAVAAVIITSSEGLHNLCQMVGAAGQNYLRHSLMVVPHPRIAATAREMGMLQVVASASADEALVQTVIQHACS